jgi:hypothetical protein
LGTVSGCSGSVPIGQTGSAARSEGCARLASAHHLYVALCIAFTSTGTKGLPTVLASESFNDGQALLQVAEKHGLEGVVSKRRGAPYKSGACRRWRKIKTTAWREANRERWRLFSSEVDLLRNSQSRCSNRQERTGEII